MTGTENDESAATQGSDLGHIYLKGTPAARAGDYARSAEMVALLLVTHRVVESLPACIGKVRKMVGWISGHQQRGTFVHVCNIYLGWLCKDFATDGWCSIEHDTSITPLH